jgi:hypothetical protein
VLDKICSTYHVQPGDLLVWFPGEDTKQESNVKQDELAETKLARQEIEDKPLHRRKRTRSLLTVIPEVASSA